MKNELIKKLKNELAGRDSAMVEITAKEAELIIDYLTEWEQLFGWRFGKQQGKIQEYPPIELKNLKNPE